MSFWGHSHCSYQSWASFPSGTGSCKLSRGRYCWKGFVFSNWSDTNIIVSRRWHNAQNQFKAYLVHQLEQDVSIIQTLPSFYISRTTLIRDGMPLLQSINAKRFRIFGEMALDFVKNQISCFQLASVVVDILDRYDIQNSYQKGRTGPLIQVCFHCKNLWGDWR